MDGEFNVWLYEWMEKLKYEFMFKWMDICMDE